MPVAKSLIANDIPSMNAATGEKYVSNGEGSWATRSGFFRVNYTFADRYLMEFNGRYDLSSKFPKHDRSAFNPSFLWDGNCQKKPGLKV